MGLGPWHIYMQKLLLAHGGGGGGGAGGDILKNVFRISIYYNIKLIVLPKILHL